jgi:hypothetical protein
MTSAVIRNRFISSEAPAAPSTDDATPLPGASYGF